MPLSNTAPSPTAAATTSKAAMSCRTTRRLPKSGITAHRPSATFISVITAPRVPIGAAAKIAGNVTALVTATSVPSKRNTPPNSHAASVDSSGPDVASTGIRTASKGAAKRNRAAR
jgi:hypothetical protein